MDNKAYTFKLLGIPFNVTNVISGLIAAILVFLLVFLLSRRLSIRPGKSQNVLEWIIDFTTGIVRGAMPGEDGKQFYLLAFVLFLFIFMSNQLGLVLQIIIGDVTVVKSPTANPVITMSMALIVLLMSHYFGIKKFGFKGYLSSFVKPMGMMLPINILEEFTNFLTLSLRLYGNIFAGEVLLTLIGSLALSKGFSWITIATIPLELIWQGFSVFIGSIQAYIFVTLGSVYISRKLEMEE